MPIITITLTDRRSKPNKNINYINLRIALLNKLPHKRIISPSPLNRPPTPDVLIRPRERPIKATKSYQNTSSFFRKQPPPRGYIYLLRE